MHFTSSDSNFFTYSLRSKTYSELLSTVDCTAVFRKNVSDILTTRASSIKSQPLHACAGKIGACRDKATADAALLAWLVQPAVADVDVKALQKMLLLHNC